MFFLWDVIEGMEVQYQHYGDISYTDNPIINCLRQLFSVRIISRRDNMNETG